ncbi:COQ9 family protein [Stella sp.]|uniref:COQ9 family protein n=1 Tax=Stella sp. TaxID=2912054 RepID=UPI0035B09D33
MTMSDRREALVLAAAANAAFDGWTMTAIRAGARDCGIPAAEVPDLLPGGETELLVAFSEWADRQMLAHLGQLPMEAMKIRDRIAAAVRARIDVLAPYREAVRRGAAVLSLPHMAPTGARLVWRTVDAVWYAAGDRSTDASWYTRRALLAGVYSSTLVYWMNDRSPGHAESWAFLDRRIADVMRIPRLRQQAESLLKRLPDPRRFLRAGPNHRGRRFLGR